MAVNRSPFDSVFIANRGEIAVRVARTCRVMGIRSIAVYSDADVGALHVQECDEAVSIGGVSAKDSYLRADRIISAARQTGAQALHPGYGFLSENADFAQACADAGIVFIGPSPAAMRAMGDKIAAKEAVVAVGVPVVPGYLGRDASTEILEEQAKRIGTPLLIKAAAGGGGRGMRLVQDLAQFSAALEAAQREAKASFGDGTVFLERYIARPRHIEVQILADQHGTCLALGERECSIQRRYQKVLEESPSPAVSSDLRKQLEQAAIKAAQAVRYTNAGTAEFMLDEDGRFYFLEMNARLQVEHPVTEAVTGIDLVREQILVAAGGKLTLDKRELQARGHAIEVRIYAEDAERDFLPSSGTITDFAPPEGPGIRNDVAVAPGSNVSPAYDPMLGKLIVLDQTRAHSIDRLRSALDDYVVGGITTNLPFLHWIVREPDFIAGKTSTDFLERHFSAALLAQAREPALILLAGAGASQYLGGWQHSVAKRSVRFSGTENPIEIAWDYAQGAWRCRLAEEEALIDRPFGSIFRLRHNGKSQKFAAWTTTDGIAVSLSGKVERLKLEAPPSAEVGSVHHAGAEATKGSVTAPMSGTIVKVNVKHGDDVGPQQVMVVMEAMKMEHAVVAPYPGKVNAVAVKSGDTVAAGQTLVEILEE